MEAETRPSWVVAAEHGTLAEARTRAFLLERFWVLERSIDLEGADFIIQRRLTTRSLFDRAPLRLGVVQSKYFGNGTTHYLHREYVLDAYSNPRPEFFLMCHSGPEDNAKAYYLTAQQISDEFTLSPADHSRPDRFVLPAAGVCATRFEIRDKSFVLSEMEHSLRSLDVSRNRSFMSWALPSLRETREPIPPEYDLPIENWWGDIGSGVEDVRDAARTTIFDLEDALAILSEIESSGDVIRVMQLGEELWQEHRGSIRIQDDVWNPDLSTTVLAHKRRADALKEAGCTQDFLVAYKGAVESVQAYLRSMDRSDGMEYCRVTLTYRPADFRKAWCVAEPIAAPSDDPDPYRPRITATPGDVVWEGNVACLLDWQLYAPQGIREEQPQPKANAIEQTAERIALSATSAALSLFVGEEID